MAEGNNWQAIVQQPQVAMAGLETNKNSILGPRPWPGRQCKWIGTNGHSGKESPLALTCHILLGESLGGLGIAHDCL